VESTENQDYSFKYPSKYYSNLQATFLAVSLPDHHQAFSSLIYFFSFVPIKLFFLFLVLKVVEMNGFLELSLHLSHRLFTQFISILL